MRSWYYAYEKIRNELLTGYLDDEALTQGFFANVDTNGRGFNAKDSFCTRQFAVYLDNSACMALFMQYRRFMAVQALE